jgi:hypothetical protein
MMRAPSFKAVIAMLVIPLVLVGASMIAAAIMMGDPLSWWYLWYAVAHDAIHYLAWNLFAIWI